MREELSRLFGGYRAEWLGEMVFELFTAPDYLPELLTDRPCLLFGGRGTGKTTVLRGLSYEGRERLSGNDSQPQSWPYFGFYLRVNTNRVTAFQGPELSQDKWTKCFAHYLNLLLCSEVLRFVGWFEGRTGAPLDVEEEELALVAASFNLPPVIDLKQLRLALTASRVRFEAYINNVVDGDLPDLTMLGAPLDQLFEMLHRTPRLKGKLFFFLIDEYENLADYQQEVMNTLIKHSGSLYTFKVGIKELGLRRRSTLNDHEQLISPADYERIDITARLQQEGFSDFAARVCNDRLRRLNFARPIDADVRRVLPGFTEIEEAYALGVEAHVRALRAALRPDASDEELVGFDNLTPLEAYLVGFWATAQQRTPLETLREALAQPSAWKARLENYQHAMLFTLRRRKRGVHKYYCGWDTYALMANGNIRYLLQLVAEALLRQHDKDGHVGRVDQVEQTLAAQEVGHKNLTELEGLAVNGAQLTRLVLGLGRVFQVMARQAEGHTPETTQFFLADGDYSLQPDSQPLEPVFERAREVLTAAIMHQALVRSVANKLPASSGDTKDYDYSLHPIFSAFFEYSHRRKRRMQLSSRDLIGLVDTPRSTIAQVLDRSGRRPNEDLPEQLELFAGYFHAVS